MTETLLFGRDLADADTAMAVWKLAQDVVKECGAKSGLKLKAPEVRDLEWVRDDRPRELFGRNPFISSGVARRGSVSLCTGILGVDAFKGDSITSSTLFCRGSVTLRGALNSLIVCDSVRPPAGFEFKQCRFDSSVVITRSASEITYLSDSCWVTWEVGRQKPQVSKGTIVEEDPSKPLFPMVRARDLGFEPAAGEKADGFAIGAVTDGGPAAKAGLAKGDKVTALNGRPVRDGQSLLALVRQVVIRGRAECYLTVIGPKTTRYVRVEFPQLLDDKSGR